VRTRCVTAMIRNAFVGFHMPRRSLGFTVPGWRPYANRKKFGTDADEQSSRSTIFRQLPADEAGGTSTTACHAHCWKEKPCAIVPCI